MRSPGSACSPAAPAANPDRPPPEEGVERIQPPHGFAAPDLRELWRCRELVWFLALRDVKVRYRQTILGAAWAILQPFLAMVVFTIFFHTMAGIEGEGVPYPLFSFAALLPWTFISQGTTQASTSLVHSADLLRRVAFPRLAAPVGATAAGLLDLLIAAVVLFGMMAWYGVAPGAGALLLPLLVLLAFALVAGLGSLLAAVNVRYRDVKYVVPFLLQLWLFASPVIYPTASVTAMLEKRGIPGWLYGLNPAAGTIEGFRRALFGAPADPAARVDFAPLLAASAGSTLVFLVLGVLLFRRLERDLADVV